MGSPVLLVVRVQLEGLAAGEDELNALPPELGLDLKLALMRPKPGQRWRQQ